MQVAQDKFQWRAVVTTVLELLGSIKDGEFRGQLSDYQFLKEDSAAWSYFGIELSGTSEM